jgi:hypothetical protein
MNDEALKSLEWADDERALWDAGRAEVPDPEAEARLLKSLGLDSPGPGGGEPKGEPSGVRPESVAAPRRPFVKWAVLGVVAVGIPLFLVLKNAEAPSTKVAPAPSLRVKMDEPAPSKTVASPSPPASEAVALQDLGEATPSGNGASRPGASSPSDAGAKAPSLSEELAFVRKARAEVAGGDLAAASKTLDTYQTTFPKPRLGAEATVLRVEILMKRGDKAAAEKLAAPLLTSGSPYQKRLSTLLGNP